MHTRTPMRTHTHTRVRSYHIEHHRLTFKFQKQFHKKAFRHIMYACTLINTVIQELMIIFLLPYPYKYRTPSTLQYFFLLIYPLKISSFINIFLLGCPYKYQIIVFYWHILTNITYFIIFYPHTLTDIILHEPPSSNEF